MLWATERTKEFNEWLGSLAEPERKQVAASIQRLKDAGPHAGRPHVDTVKGSRYPNMKELRANRTIRIFFAFDSQRKAVLLVGGDKAGMTKRFYRQMVERADKIYDAHLRRMRRE